MRRCVIAIAVMVMLAATTPVHAMLVSDDVSAELVQFAQEEGDKKGFKKHLVGVLESGDSNFYIFEHKMTVDQKEIKLEIKGDKTTGEEAYHFLRSLPSHSQHFSRISRLHLELYDNTGTAIWSGRKIQVSVNYHINNDTTVRFSYSYPARDGKPDFRLLQKFLEANLDVIQ